MLVMWLLLLSVFAQARELTFLVTSDPHFGSEPNESFNTAQILAMNDSLREKYPAEIGGAVGTPGFVLIPGDLVERGYAPDSWTGPGGFIAHFGLNGTDGMLKYPVYEGRGNHDVNNDTDCNNCITNWITQRHGNIYYSFNADGVHFVCLDFYPTSEILGWLRSDLKNMPDANMPVVLFQHIPPANKAWQNLDVYMNIIRGYNIIALFHGHDHRSEHYIFEDPWSDAKYDFFNTGSPKGGNRYFYVVHITDDAMTVVENDWWQGKSTWRNYYTKNITSASYKTPALPSGMVYATSVSSKCNYWRFAVYGDSRGDANIPSLSVNTAILSEIVDATVKENVDFVLFPGDMVYGHPGSPQNFEDQMMVWRNTMQPIYDKGIKVYGVRGNHECHEPYNKVIWDKIFSGRYALPDNGPANEKNITFSLKYKNAFIVGLDLYLDPSRLNQAWLDEQFAENNLPHVFVFAHEPAFKVTHESCIGYYPDERDRFWDSLTKEGARAYFAGHDHYYNHARLDDGDGNPQNDLHQFIVGTAGAGMGPWDGLYDGNNGRWKPEPVHYEKEYGYMLVEVNGPNVIMTWKHRTGPNSFGATSDVFRYTVSETPGSSTGKDTAGHNNAAEAIAVGCGTKND